MKDLIKISSLPCSAGPEQRPAIFPNSVIYVNRHIYIRTDTAVTLGSESIGRWRHWSILFAQLVNVGHLLWNLSRDTGGDLNLKSTEAKIKCVTVRSRPLRVV